MLTKQQLKQGLEDISASTARPDDLDRVECVRLNFFQFNNSSYKYNAEVITYLKSRHKANYYDSFAEKWIKKFSTLTNSSWCPIAWGDRKRLPYRRAFSCHFKAYTVQSVTYTKVAQNIIKLVGGPSDCLSNIIFKFSLPNSKRKKESSFIVIEIDTSYCKRIYIQNYFLELASGDKSWNENYMRDVKGPAQDHSEPLVRLDGLYYKYFADGHTYRTAKMLHLLTLLCEYGNDAKIFSDPTKNPTMSYVSILNKHYKSYMKDVCSNFEVIMSRKQAEMEQLGGLIRFQSQDVVTLITPTMKRVLSSCELDEVIISSTAVSQGPTVTLFFVPSKVGALSFACVLHKTKEGYTKGFSTIKSIIEKDYSKTFNPNSVVISDISLMEQKVAAETVFQNSKVLIAPWSLCSDAWIWICNSKLTTKRHWHEAMVGFHDVMNATSSESAHEKYKEFVSTVGSTDLRFVKDYVDDIWKQYSFNIWWSTANNSLVVLSIKILQQLFIAKCASFDIIQLCDIIIMLDKHFQNILLSWVDTKQPIFKTHLIFLDKSELKSLKLELTSPHEFLLDSGFLTKLRTDTWCCDCVVGRKSLFCEHLCTLLDQTDLAVPLSCDEKHFFKQIAGKKEDSIADGNCKKDYKSHPTYTDGYYLFHIPININPQFTYNRKSFNLSLSGQESYNLIINNLTEKYKSNTFSEVVQDKGVETKQTNKRLIEEGDSQKNNSEYNRKVEKTLDSESHSKASLHNEIDLKIEKVHTGNDEADENFVEEVRSEAFMDASSSVNNFEAEYNTALDNLRIEFKKFTDGLRLSSSSNMLDRIVQLTKEFSTTKMKLLKIKSEPEDPNVD